MTDLQHRGSHVLSNYERAIRAVAWLLAALALGIFLWRTVLPATRSNTFAFSVYYTSARLTLQGQADARICSEWLYEQQRSLGFGNRADAFCGFGPPTMALVMTPIAWLPPNVARIIWVILDLGMIAAICVLAWQISKIKDWLTSLTAAIFIPVSLILLGLFQPINAEISAVQMHIFLALLYALWQYGYLTKRDWLCGAALAVLALVKLAGLPLWIFMLFSRRWRALAWAIGLTLITSLITVPLFTAQFWLLDLRKTLALSGRPESAVPAYQTVLSLLRQTFVYDEKLSPRPLVDAPWLESLSLAAISVALLATTLIAARKARGTDGELLSAMAMMCLVVPLQPAGEQYHYSQLFIVLLVVVSSTEPWFGRVGATVSLAAVLVLFALPGYFLRTQDFIGFPIALLAYPRLYGALMLWALLIFGSIKSPSKVAHRSNIANVQK